MQAVEKGHRGYGNEPVMWNAMDLRITNHGVVGTGYEGATTLQLNGHTEWNREGSFVGLRFPSLRSAAKHARPLLSLKTARSGISGQENSIHCGSPWSKPALSPQS